MSTVHNIDQVQRRAEEAIDWLLRLGENPGDDNLLDAWLEWCGRDPENLAEFRRACDLWNAFDSEEMETLLAISATKQTASSSSEDLPLPSRERAGERGRQTPHAGRSTPLASLADALPRQPARRRRTRFVSWKAGMGAAAAVLAAIATAFLAQQRIDDLGREIHTTQVAQHDTDLLADGSVLEVGAASRVTSRYDEERREIEVKEGEAFFEVAHDPERPFVVKAGEVRVRAVGTAFNVRRGATRTVVTVSEGTVEVQFDHWYDLLTPAEKRRALASAGQQVIYDRATGTLRTERANPEAATAWRQDSRSFSFLNEPLADVIAYVNRYSERKIEIVGDALAHRTFTGTVHHDRGEDWLRALERAYPLRVQREGDGGIRLVPTNRTLAEQG